MISDSQTYYRLAPWLMVFPGLAIVYTVTAFNFLGYGLLAHDRRGEMSGRMTRCVGGSCCCVLRCWPAAALGADSATRRAAYLRLADQDDIPTLDPARGYDTASWQFEEMLFNTLVDYDDGGQLVPELATDWEISADSLTYTFHLRTDVRFTNGRPVVAADMRYAIERVLDPHTQSPGAEFFRGIDGAAECDRGALPRRGHRGARCADAALPPASRRSAVPAQAGDALCGRGAGARR